MDLGLNLLDYGLLLALALAFARGLRRGALSQVATFGGAAAGLLAGAAGAPALASAIVDQPGLRLSLVTFGVLLVAVLVGQGLGLAIGIRLQRAAARAGIAALDRFVGVLVSLAGFVVVVWLLASMLAQGPVPQVAQQVQGSRLVAELDRRLPPPPDIVGRIASFLDQQGFPQVFTGVGGPTLTAPVPPTSDAAVRAAAAAGQPATVQVRATGCGGISSGTGFAAAPGFVVTNAHVVAGGAGLVVRDAAGEHEAVAVHFDDALDLAVLRVPGLQATPIRWAADPAGRATEGATLGFPGGQRELVVKPATVRGRGEAVGRDIYGRSLAPREVLTLAADVQQGDSGGPFVTAEGTVGGVVFAANAAAQGEGYALTAERVRPDVDAAIARDTAADLGRCRF